MLASMLTVATSIAVAGLLAAESRGARRAIWVAKTSASLGFVATALALEAAAHARGRWLLLALALCAVGDVLLLPRAARAFRAGVVAFALGHVAYGVVLAREGLHVPALLVALAVLGPVAWLGFRWLRPGAPPALVPLVALYCALLTGMAALACGAVATTGELRVGIGGIAFYLSDLCVARERFVRPALINRLVGLPLYYAAQLLLAWALAPTP